MIKLRDALSQMILSNSYLQWWLSNDILNLTQVASMLHKDLELATKKELKTTSIVMALSRIRQEIPQPVFLRVDPTSMSLVTDLRLATYPRRHETDQILHIAYKNILESREFLVMTTWLRETTVVFPSKYTSLLESLSQKPLYENDRVGAISIGLPHKSECTPGILSAITQKIFTHGINIIEVASTTSEFIIILEEKDIQSVYSILSQK